MLSFQLAPVYGRVGIKNSTRECSLVRQGVNAMVVASVLQCSPRRRRADRRRAGGNVLGAACGQSNSNTAASHKCETGIVAVPCCRPVPADGPADQRNYVKDGYCNPIGEPARSLTGLLKRQRRASVVVLFHFAAGDSCVNGKARPSVYIFVYHMRTAEAHWCQQRSADVGAQAQERRVVRAHRQPLVAHNQGAALLGGKGGGEGVGVGGDGRGGQV